MTDDLHPYVSTDDTDAAASRGEAVHRVEEGPVPMNVHRVLIATTLALSLLALVFALLNADWSLALAHTTAVLGFGGWLFSESTR